MSDFDTQRQIAALLSLADPEACRRILQVLGNAAALRELEKAEQGRFVLHLQALGTGRKVIAARLTQRFSISPATAYRLLQRIFSDSQNHSNVDKTDAQTAT